MKIYIKSTKITSADKDMQSKIQDLADRIAEFYDMEWNPYEEYDENPSTEQIADWIQEEIDSGRNTVSLDDEVSYNLQELWNDIKDDEDADIQETANHALSLLNEVKALRGITTVTSATRPLRPVNDYLALRAMYNDKLYNAILDGDVAYVQQFIENQDPEDIERYDRNLDMKALMVETQQSADEMNEAINRGERWMGM